MALPDFSLRQLLEAGVHFGHQTHRWNPKMGRYIYGDRNGIHIIDLTQTVPLLDAALQAMCDCVAKGGRILFVGTKRQAAQPLADAAGRSAQYFMNHRWLGGTLTNWKTVSNSINRLKSLDEQLDNGAAGFTKKERLNLERERTKLQASLGGIRDMGSVPDMVFVIDTNKEALAIAEARKLRIPVVAVLDTNSDPDGVDYPIPGNDDASRAIALYTDLAARAVIAGMTSQLGAAGFDLGELEDAPVEEAIAAEPVVEVEAPAEVAVEAAVEAAPEAPAEVAVEAPVEVAVEAPVEAVAEAPAEEAAAEEAVAEEPKKAAPKKAAPKKAAAKAPKKAPKKAPAKADAEEAPAEPAAEDEAAAS
jgi:small subunit ribosomal protein S2